MSKTIEDSHYQLLKDIAELYDKRIGTDLQILCGTAIFNVHKAIFCARSPVFRRALEDSRWKEGREGVFVLGRNGASEEEESDIVDDSVAVELMVMFMYHGDYEASQDPYAVEDTVRGVENALDNNTERAGAPVAERGGSDHGGLPLVNHEVHAIHALEEVDKRLKAEDVQADDNNKVASMRTGILNLHAKIYALGHRYDMPTLMDRAVEKFEFDAARLHWDNEAFCNVMDTAVSSTPDNDNGLRRVIVDILHDRSIKKLLSTELDNHICSIPSFAVALWRRSTRYSEAGPRPRCLVCNTMEVRQCKRHFGISNVERGWFAACACFPQQKACTDIAGAGTVCVGMTVQDSNAWEMTWGASRKRCKMSVIQAAPDRGFFHTYSP